MTWMVYLQDGADVDWNVPVLFATGRMFRTMVSGNVDSSPVIDDVLLHEGTRVIGILILETNPREAMVGIKHFDTRDRGRLRGTERSVTTGISIGLVQIGRPLRTKTRYQFVCTHKFFYDVTSLYQSNKLFYPARKDGFLLVDLLRIHNLYMR